MIRLVVGLDRHSLGRINQVFLAAVARMIADVYTSVFVHAGGASVEHTEIRFAAVVEGHVAYAVASQGELLAFAQRCRQRMFYGVGSMDDIAAGTCFRGEMRFASYGIVVEGEDAYGEMHLLGGVAGHAYNLPEKIGYIGIVFSPLHTPYIVAVCKVFKRETEIFVLFIYFYGCHRAVFIFKTDFAARDIGFHRVIVAAQRFVVKRQQRRRLVGRTEIAVILGAVVHSGNVPLGIDLDSEVVGL